MFSVAWFMGIWFPVQISTVGPGQDIFLLNDKFVVVVTVHSSEVIQTRKKVKHYMTLLLLCIARTISRYSQSP